MTFELLRLPLPLDAPGTSAELAWYRLGPPDAKAKVYLQAALHADELPGTMVLHHLLPMLRDADAGGQLRARFSVVPMANPIGMSNLSFRRHLGRYDPGTGLNYNRRWPDLFAALGEVIAPLLTEDAAENIATIRNAVRTFLDEQQPSTAAQALRLALLREAQDADFVLDLHCDDEALPHIFTSPEFMPGLQDLADWMGLAATLTATDSGGGSFDEMLPIFYRKLGAANPGKPVPMASQTATLEYRGQADVSDKQGFDDAERLFGFFAGRGLIAADTGPRPDAAPAATPFEATEVLRVEAPGLLAYRVRLGDRVKRGDVVADLIALDGPEPFVSRTPITAGTDGLVLSQRQAKYVRRGDGIAKIVGTEPLPERGSYLLED